MSLLTHLIQDLKKIPLIETHFSLLPALLDYQMVPLHSGRVVEEVVPRPANLAFHISSRRLYPPVQLISN